MSGFRGALAGSSLALPGCASPYGPGSSNRGAIPSAYWIMPRQRDVVITLHRLSPSLALYCFFPLAGYLPSSSAPFCTTLDSVFCLRTCRPPSRSSPLALPLVPFLQPPLSRQSPLSHQRVPDVHPPWSIRMPWQPGRSAQGVSASVPLLPLSKTDRDTCLRTRCISFF